jgi:tetratricopeptide (TPR) repeat protein
MPPEVQEWVIRGDDALQRGDFGSVLSVADSIMASGYGQVEGNFLKARALFELGNYTQAESLFVVVLDLAPDYPGTRHNLGNIYYFQKQYRRALDNFLSEAERGNDKRSWHAVAGVYSELGKLDSAEVAISKSISIDNTYAPAWLSRAMYAEQRGDSERALEFASRSFSLDSTESKVWPVLARLENQIGDASRAEAIMLRLAQVDPWSYTALFELGRSYQRMGKPDLATTYFERSNALRDMMRPVEMLEMNVRTLPSDFAQRIRLAEANRQIQRWDQAAIHYEAALTLRPENIDLASNLAALYLQMGQKQQARALLESVLDKDPRHFNALVNLSIMAIEEGDMERALRFLEQAREINPDHPMLARIRGLMGEQP